MKVPQIVVAAAVAVVAAGAAAWYLLVPKQNERDKAEDSNDE